MQNQGKVTKDATEESGEETELVETTAGRVLLYQIVPPKLPFSLVNKVMDKKAISSLINVTKMWVEGHMIFADQMMYTGFRQSTASGASVGVDDFVIPRKRAK